MKRRSRRSMRRRLTHMSSHSALGKLVHSIHAHQEPYGIDRDDALGGLSRMIKDMQDEMNNNEIDLHTMIIEREHQENLMRTIESAAFALLATAVEHEEQFDEALQEGLSVVAQCVDVDGIYVWRNDALEGDAIFNLQAQWVNSIGEAKRVRPLKSRHYYKETPNWDKRFALGMPINALRDELEQKEKDIIDPGTQSILILPVHLHERFWGLVFFEDCKRMRTFSSDQINLLQSASIMIVSAVRRKKQAARVNEANARVKLMMDATPIGCMLWSRDYRVFDCNPAAIAMFNAKDKEDLITRIKSQMPLYQPNERRSIDLKDEYLEKVFDEGSHDYEWICRTFDDIYFPAEINLRRVYFGGEYVVAEYVRDVRAEKQLMHEVQERRQQLESALKDAQKASQAKSNFLSNMSHEIRTPLNAITGMTSLGKAAGSWRAKDEAFQKIESASSHLLGVINDVLDMSKIEAGKLEIYREAFDLEKTLSKVLNIIQFRVHEKKQSFFMDIAENVPPVIISDDQRLTQVLTNLLGNAVKFTPEGKEIRLRIETVQREGDHCILQFAIIDQGIGIGKKQQLKLFDSFTQAEASTTRKFGGTGLGLSISKHIVEILGGQIWVESEINKGSAFYFTIEADVQDTKEEVSSQGEGYHNRSYPGKILLLAEDIEINQEIVVALLESAEIKVDCANNGEEAYQMFQENPTRYDMILMDVHMPVMDGFNATRKIRNLKTTESQAIPIVAMTANVFRDDIEKCLASGMNAHLGKPLDMEAVMSTLWTYLS